MESGRAILIREKGQEVVCTVIEEDRVDSQGQHLSKYRRLTKDPNGKYEIDGRRWRAEPRWQRGLVSTVPETVELFKKEERWPRTTHGPIQDISSVPNNLPFPWNDDITA